MNGTGRASIRRMKKRRFEIAALAALILFAAADRPSLPAAPDIASIADVFPANIDTVRDVGVVAVKLVVLIADGV